MAFRVLFGGLFDGLDVILLSVSLLNLLVAALVAALLLFSSSFFTCIDISSRVVLGLNNLIYSFISESF